MTFTLNAIKNPNPKFEQSKPAGLPILRKIMEKADGVYSSKNFDLVLALAVGDGRIKRRPTANSVKVLEALTQAAVYSWDIIADRVATTAHRLAISTGLATETKSNLGISRVSRHLHLLHRLNLIHLSKTSYRKDLGCYEPITFTFTPLFFELVDISAKAIDTARASQVASENKKRKAKGWPVLSLLEMAAQRVRNWIDTFAEIVRNRKAAGERRHQRRQDAERTRKEIFQIVYRSVIERMRKGLFTARNAQELRDEVERITNKRMIERSLDTRLAATS